MILSRPSPLYSARYCCRTRLSWQLTTIPGSSRVSSSILPGVVVVENSEAPGLSGTRNSGLAVARGSHIVFLDDDAIAAPDWLTCLSIAFARPHASGVGGAIEPLWLGGRPTWFPPEFNWVVGCTYLGSAEMPATVRNLIGCNMAFQKRSSLLSAGFGSGGSARCRSGRKTMRRSSAFASERPAPKRSCGMSQPRQCGIECHRAARPWPTSPVAVFPRASPRPGCRARLGKGRRYRPSAPT